MRRAAAVHFDEHRRSAALTSRAGYSSTQRGSSTPARPCNRAEISTAASGLHLGALAAVGSNGHLRSSWRKLAPALAPQAHAVAAAGKLSRGLEQ